MVSMAGEIGNGVVVVEFCIEAVDLRVKGPFVPVLYRMFLGVSYRSLSSCTI
jgi:hypothetical protein